MGLYTEAQQQEFIVSMRQTAQGIAFSKRFTCAGVRLTPLNPGDLAFSSASS